MVEDIMRKFQPPEGQASVQAAFGEPRTVGNRTVIPVASVAYGYGMGFGEGSEGTERAGEGVQGETERPVQPPTSTGRGGGGGGGVRVKPLAVVEITPEKTTVLPIIDLTRVSIAGILLAAWNVFWITKTIRAASRKR